MTETIVLAEIAKGTVLPTTAELITAAQKLGSQPIVVVPCTDASIADIAASYAGSARVIAAKSDVFSNYDAAGWAAALDAVAPSGVLIASASPQSKDLAARIAARRGISVVQDVVKIDGNNLTSPIYSGKRCKLLPSTEMRQLLCDQTSLMLYRVMAQQMFQW